MKKEVHYLVFHTSLHISFFCILQVLFQLFYIFQDGDRITYSIHDYSTSRDVNSGLGTWVLFDKVNNYLTAMPLREHRGTSKFILRATDVKGGTTDVHLTTKVANMEDLPVTQVNIHS